MNDLILFLVLLVVGGMVYLGRLPGIYLVRRSQSMQVDRPRVLGKVRDMTGHRRSTACTIALA